MPSNAVLEQKKQVVAELAGKLQKSVTGVLVDYKGINVETDTKLRKELREAGVDYFVAKNTLMRFAAAETGLTELDPFLEGTTALALSESDYTAAAKILSKYASSKDTKFSIKAGFVDGGVIDKNQVEALAKLPSREQLIATVLAGFNAPISGLAGVTSGLLRSVVIALNAVAEKQSA